MKQPSKPQTLRGKTGFTIIELVVSISIVTVLISAFAPSLAGRIVNKDGTNAMANAKLIYTTASALASIWDVAERPTYGNDGDIEDQKRTYADKYLMLDDKHGGKRLEEAIENEQLLTDSVEDGSIFITYEDGKVVSVTFTHSEEKGGKSATYTSLGDDLITLS